MWSRELPAASTASGTSWQVTAEDGVAGAQDTLFLSRPLHAARHPLGWHRSCCQRLPRVPVAPGLSISVTVIHRTSYCLGGDTVTSIPQKRKGATCTGQTAKGQSRDLAPQPVPELPVVAIIIAFSR